MFRTFGYFGKGFVAPAPEPGPSEPTAAIKAEAAVEEGVTTEFEPEAFETPKSTIIPAQESPENAAIRARLAMIKSTVAAQKAEKDSKLQALHEKQAKQAAYGRDVTQARPKEAGYATESEKIMGGQTGYGNYSHLGKYSQLGQPLEQAADNIRRATKVVEQVTKDVKMGMATSSELEVAMADLTKKVKEAQAIEKSTKGLKGYGEETKGWSPFWIVAVIGVLYFLLKPKA